MNKLDARMALVCYLTMITFQFYDWLVVIEAMDRAAWIGKRIVPRTWTRTIRIWKMDYG